MQIAERSGPTEWLYLAKRNNTEDSSLNYIVDQLSTINSKIQSKILVSIIHNPNVSKSTIFNIANKFHHWKELYAIIETPHFDDEIFQLIRPYANVWAIYRAIGTNKLSVLSLIALAADDNDLIRKSALEKLSDQPL